MPIVCFLVILSSHVYIKSLQGSLNDSILAQVLQNMGLNQINKTIMKKITFFGLLLSIALFMAACQKDETANPSSSANVTPTINTLVINGFSSKSYLGYNQGTIPGVTFQVKGHNFGTEDTLCTINFYDNPTKNNKDYSITTGKLETGKVQFTFTLNKITYTASSGTVNFNDSSAKSSTNYTVKFNNITVTNPSNGSKTLSGYLNYKF